MRLIDSIPFDPPLCASERDRVDKIMREKSLPEIYALAIALGAYRGVSDLPNRGADGV